MTTVRTLIVVASSRKWKTSQLDIKNDFLNGDLNEEVFMTPPPGVSHKPGESKCIADLLDRTRITNKMVEDIPIDAKANYTLTNGDPLSDPSLYLTIMGSLDYLTTTHPDISYAVHIVSQFVSAPTISTTGFCIFLADSLISRKSKKQNVLSKSSTEAEYHAMGVTTSEIVWLRWLVADMGVHINHSTPLHCDNHNAIQITRNSVFHEHTKHIEMDCHFTLHHLTISLPFDPSALQIADVFTKPHFGLHFRFLTDKLSMFHAAAL
ncbi:uncharacterized mitochondrial protein-like protein [Tanacetum coccineum]